MKKKKTAKKFLQKSNKKNKCVLFALQRFLNILGGGGGSGVPGCLGPFLLSAMDFRGAGEENVVGGASSLGGSKEKICCFPAVLFVLCEKGCFFHSVPRMQHTFKLNLWGIYVSFI